MGRGIQGTGTSLIVQSSIGWGVFPVELLSFRENRDLAEESVSLKPVCLRSVLAVAWTFAKHNGNISDEFAALEPPRSAPGSILFQPRSTTTG